MTSPIPPFYGSIAASGGIGDISLGAALPGHADLKLATGYGGTVPADRAVDYLIQYGNTREWGTGTVRTSGFLARTNVAGTIVDGVEDTVDPAPLDIAAGARITWEQAGPDRTFGAVTVEDVRIDGTSLVNTGYFTRPGGQAVRDLNALPVEAGVYHTAGRAAGTLHTPPQVPDSDAGTLLHVQGAAPGDNHQIWFPVTDDRGGYATFYIRRERAAAFTRWAEAVVADENGDVSLEGNVTAQSINLGTGHVTLARDPAQPLEAATKHYVDDLAATPEGIAGSAPSLDLNFAAIRDGVHTHRGTLPAALTTTRAGTATRVNGRGVVETVAANTARLDHDPATLEPLGLLVEEQRTNFLLNSGGIGKSGWGTFQSTLITDTARAPDGTVTATKVIADAGSTSGLARQDFVVDEATPYTASVFVRQADFEQGNLAIFTLEGAQIARAHVATSNGVTGGFGGDIAAIAYPDGWYRLMLKFTAGPGQSSLNMRLSARNATGDGTSGILFWGAQIEQGVFATSYIPTTTVQATRTADIVSVLVDQWLRQRISTFYAETTFMPAELSVRGLFYLNNGQGNLRGYGLQLDTRQNISQAVGVTRTNAGVRQTVSPVGTLISGKNKVAFSFDTVSQTVAANGAYTRDDVTFTDADASQFFVGFANVAETSALLNGHIKRLTYWPRRLADTTLQALTA